MTENKSVNTSSYSWLTGNNELADLAEQCKKTDVIFIDTEFIRKTTYWPKAALIQIRTGEKNYLLDPLTIDNWQPLKDILVDTQLRKTIHASSEDLVVFYCLTGEHRFQNMFDTQLAHAFSSANRSIGYSALVREKLGIELQQSATIQRSNWLKRPLTEKQRQYAIQDVFYLESIYWQQKKRLANDEKRQAWIKQANDELVRHAYASYSTDPLHAYKAIKGIGKIQNKQTLARLQQIAAWRERQAQKENQVRRFILQDKTLLRLAENPPANKDTWQNIATGRFFDKSRHIPILMGYLHTTYSEQQLPETLEWFPTAYNNVYKNMAKEKHDIAQQYNISEHLLASKKQLQQYITTKGKKSFGWQDELLLARLSPLLPQ